MVAVECAVYFFKILNECQMLFLIILAIEICNDFSLFSLIDTVKRVLTRNWRPQKFKHFFQMGSFNVN